MRYDPRIQNSPASTAIVLFTGDVRREEQRKRLPRRFLASIHESLLEEMRGLPSCDVYVCGDAELTGAVGRMPAGARPVPEQISDAVSALLNGYGRVVLVAGDVCGLEQQHVSEVLRHLDGGEKRASVGRSTDGGFYLAAFNASPDVDWMSLPWFQPTIGDALIDSLNHAGFEVAVLEPLADVDDAGDARRILGTIGSIPLKLKAILRAALNATLSFVEFRVATPQRVLVTALYRRPPPR